MNWLESLDVAGFWWVQNSLRHPWLDQVMPWFSGNVVFVPAVLVLGVVLAWKGGVRGRLCVGLLVLLVLAANNSAVDALKEGFARPRPYHHLAGMSTPRGNPGNYSMPSGHTANWFAACAVVWFYYRRALCVLLPAAGLVAFSRLYLGVHYPSDVLAGALVGATVGAGGARLIDWLWTWGGRAWFPLWWRRLPSLLVLGPPRDPLAWQPDQPVVRDPEAVRQAQWLRFGYVIVTMLLLVRLGYVAAGKIQLSEDEAYQWLWSKHLDWSYYSKPPLIAYTQFAGTLLWGDTELGVRFFSPVIAAVLGFMLLRFFSREVNSRAAFWLVLVITATPLMSAGAILMTIDSLSVLCWTAGMIGGWRAVQRDSRLRDWLGVGVWLGLGFLSKYTGLLQWVSFALFLAWWAPARRQWARPGLYLALGVSLLGALPVVIWNHAHDWITLTHLRDRAGLSQSWRITARFLGDFTASEIGLLNPVLFGGMIWAVISMWRRRRHDAFLVYLLCMGAPLFLGYWLYTLRARVQPNWIAPAVLPLLCLMVAYADARWRAGARAVPTWLAVGLGCGLPLVVILHDTNLVGKILPRALPPKIDPLRRVRGWPQTAAVVQAARQALLAEGAPVFVIGDHYGTTALLSFYLPEAKAAVTTESPLVYYLSTSRPINQFYFWPGYKARRGQHAVFVSQTDQVQPAPDSLRREFESVTDLGLREIVYRGRVLRQVQLFLCRNLR